MRPGGFLASKQMDDMPAGNYHNFTLLNKEFSFDVDLSSVGCSCNAALFFVSMPGYEVNGSVARGQDQNPYYCDANKTGDVWCWEHDTLQSNKYTMATTAHVCDIQPGRYINSCDKEGCRANAFDMDPEGMGPGGYSIDTRKPFRVHQRFEANWKGKLVRIVNRMVQDGNVFTWDSCADAAYLEQMTVAFSNKMVMGFQLSGNSWKAMEWLDGMTGCTGECIPSATEVTFSEISIRSLHPVKDIVV